MTRITKAVSLLAVLSVVGLAACGDGNEDTASTTTAPQTGGTAGKKTTTRGEPAPPTIVVRDGEPVGGVAELEYDAGEQVRFRVQSDAADEVHVHGYDVEEEIPAGGAVTLSFPADIEGIFEVELHESEAQIAELRVNP